MWELLAVLTAAAPVDVVILSRHAPQHITIEGGCRAHGRPLVSLTRRATKVVGCDKTGECRARDRFEVRCRAPARFAIEGIAPRTYGRRFSVRVRDKALRVVAHIPLTAYVAGVVDKEMASGPKAARRAQAVLARTYANRAHAHPRHDDADLCDLTHCQVFAGRARQSTAELVKRTPGLLVATSGKPADVYYHSTCGGQTLDARQVWARASNAIVGVRDRKANGEAWCRDSRHFFWAYDVSERRLTDALRSVVAAPLQPGSLFLRAMDPLGQRWTVGDASRSFEASGATMHRRLGRALGWSAVKSSRFEAMRAGGGFRLRGFGLGHRVGFCQTGAIARARAGQTAEQILEAYFPRLRWAR